MRRNLFGAVLCALLMATLTLVAPGTAGAVHPKPKPTAPTALSVIPANTALVISWAAPTYTGTSPIQGYTVTIHQQKAHPTCTMTGPTTCLATGLTNGVPAVIHVRAYNAAGSGPSGYVAGIAGTVADCGYIGAYANLQGCNLAYHNLSGDNLTSADFTGAELYAANLTGANLTGANMTGADLAYDTFTGAHLAGAKLAGATFTAASTVQVTSGGVTGTPASLPTGWAVGGGFLMGPGVNLGYANLAGVTFPAADLTGANLYASNLNGATLTSATNFSWGRHGLCHLDRGDTSAERNSPEPRSPPPPPSR